MYRIGSIGAGNMGVAILDGAVKSGAMKANEIMIFDPSAEKVALSHKRGFAVSENEEGIFNNCEIILLAVAPQIYDVVLEKVKTFDLDGKIVLSIAAGISSDYIRSFLGADTKVVNVMPNTPLMIGEGATALSRTSNISDVEFKAIVDIFEFMGVVAVMNEKELAEIIPANGSTPAFAYYFMDCIARSVEKRGVDKDLALKLIAKSFIGAAEMVLQTGETPADLIDQVCTPGGLTIETINVFNKRDLFSIIDEGCVACVERGYELAK